MLDAYIIDRIRREREQERDGAFIPLHIEVPLPTQERDDVADDEPKDRGATVIDFQL